MEQLVKVTRGGQITIPAMLRRKAGIEIGDYVEIRVTDEGVVLAPKVVIDKSQAYFWTDRWQQGEAVAEADIKAGRIERFASLDALFEDLDAGK
jgi:AbrB family looped-hinge helix DNA binding protein